LVVTADIDTGWNDFSYNFLTHIHLIEPTPDPSTPPLANIKLVLPMRLMFQGQNNTLTHLHKLFSQHGPLINCRDINDPFCSILTSEEHYREIVAELSLEEAVHGLRQLGDAVVLEADGKPDPRLEIIRSRPFHLGALRKSDAYFAWRRAKRYLRRNLPEPIDDSASNFSLKAQLPGLENAYELDFDFNHSEELLRNRIAVLIGRNGVGKTQLLLSLIKSTANSTIENQVPGALADAQLNPAPKFNSLLVFSSVSSDLYPETITPWDGGLDYNYFSLIARGKENPTPKTDTITASLADIIRSNDTFELPDSPGKRLRRSSILKNAIQQHIDYKSIYLPLIPDTPFSLVWLTTSSGDQYASLHGISGEQRTLETIQRVDWTRPPIIVENNRPRRLSSGQLAMLRFAVQAIGAAQTGSLILMDEPETHLHPNFISAFMEILHSILEATRSCAIIATHSAYIVREVPRNRVLVLRSDNGRADVSKPRLQTFGASIDSISQFVFGDAEIEHLHEMLLRNWLGKETNIEAVLEKYGTELNPESLSYIRRILTRQENS
jgi:ABC-type multidrug transport system ATPase subunit